MCWDGYTIDGFIGGGVDIEGGEFGVCHFWD